ncbi:MAG: hypothetical protein HWE13_12875 [Gammaproteobacteria bacterium]|nr:hypothetical protein [Gammaproteobacteria bacterium]NVK89020.1 hypothetical protein [Gammaproteobacteria bacterium]
MKFIALWSACIALLAAVVSIDPHPHISNYVYAGLIIIWAMGMVLYGFILLIIKAAKANSQEAQNK